MLHRVCASLFYFLLPVMLFAQNGSGAYKIYYEMTFQKDSTEAELSNEMTELLTNGKKSMFRTLVQANVDTFRYHKELISSEFAYSPTSAQYRILKDYDKKNIYRYESIEPLLGTMYHTIEPQSELDWTIAADTMTLNNVLCQKATVNFGNRSWEVWFAVDIPISDGPYKFCGLPGLIVAIADKTGSWAFKLVNIENIPTFEFNLWFLESSKALDKAAFFERKQNYRFNRAQINESAGRIKFPNEEIRQGAYRSSKALAQKDNNWIELYP